jgi:hypothetical protein
MARLGRLVLFIAAVVVIACASLSVHGESITIAGVGLGQFFEHSTILLLGAALVGLGSFARRRMKQRK